MKKRNTVVRARAIPKAEWLFSCSKQAHAALFEAVIFRSELKLIVKPEPYTVERTRNWFKKQVAPSINLLLALDDMEGTHFVPDALGCAHMSDNHVRILKQVAKFQN